jgi:hypothetical protein
MLSHRPSRIAGSDSHATSGSKKNACTRGQPGVLTSPIPTATANTTVETNATSVERRARERR